MTPTASDARAWLLFLAAGCAGAKITDGTDTGTPAVDTSSGDSGALHSGDSVPVDTSNSNPDDSAETAETAETGDTDIPVDTNLYPVAPDAKHPMWQGLQTAFLRGDGTACTGSVTVGVGPTATCYTAADGALRCAGSIYGLPQQLAFTDVGLREVTQVFAAPNAGGADAGSVCALTGGRVACIGDHNAYGQFGNGGSVPAASWIAGSAASLTHLATGTWDQLCAVDEAGDAWCAGYSYGATPADLGAAAWIWVDVDGFEHLDDSRTWRASPSRADTRLTSNGLDCESIVCRYAGIEGTTGLVDAVVKQRFPDGIATTIPDQVCTLSPAGAVTCTSIDSNTWAALTTTPFAGQHVVLIAASFDNDSLCAVIDDGSMWCLGANEHGQLGTGDTLDVATEREVVPAGGVRIDCR